MSSTCEVFLIRHGQSANNAGEEHQRVCDPALTQAGSEQADHTAQWLVNQEVHFLYCSPFLRSLETTKPAATQTGLTPLVHPEIFEQGGCYSGHAKVGKRGEPGMTRSEIESKYPGWRVHAEISESGWWNRDFESPEEAEARAARVCDWLCESISPQPGRHALIIHADFKYLLLRQLIEVQGGGYFDLREPLYNTGISHFQWANGRWDLISLNSIEHLPASLKTC